MEESFYEKLVRLKEMLINAATDGYNGPSDYEDLRLEWLQHPLLKHKAPESLRKYRTLTEFRTFSQSLGGYKERRAHIQVAFAEVLANLEREGASPSDDVVTGKLRVFDSAHIREAWQKALDRRNSDSEGAITSARTLLESICKHILEECSASYDDKADLPKLYSLAAAQLKLAPSQYTEQVFKQILGGCQAVVEGLGALRNKHSDAHGKGKRAVKPAERHAELAVNLSGSMSLFLLATLEHKQSLANGESKKSRKKFDEFKTC